MSQSQIIIDPNEELRIVFRLLYYNISGFYLNAKKLQKKCQDEGFWSLQLWDIAKWLEYQYSYQIYWHPLLCKAEVSFSKIKILNKVHQCDILLYTHNQDSRRVFVCSFLIIDMVTRFKNRCSLILKNSLEI